MRFLYYGLCLLFVTALLSGCGGVRVRKGDTLFSISQEHDIPMREIIEANNLEAPYTLFPGQYLVLPKIKTHRVRRGETLYSIADQYHMSVSSLAGLNRIQPPYDIHNGQVLRVASWTGEEPKSIFTEEDHPDSGEKTVGAKRLQSEIKGSVAQDRKQEAARRKAVKNPAAFRGKANVPKAQTKRKFSWPVSGKIVSAFGNGNDGINIAGKAGTAVKAAEDGTVAYAGNQLKGYGNLILIKHKDGWITAYAHNQKLVVKKGSVVKKGQKIAEMGSTGGVKTPQLHFEIRYKAKVVNPKQYLP